MLLYRAPQGIFVYVPDNLLDHLAAFEQQQGGNSLYLVGASGADIIIDVEFTDFQFPCQFAGHGLDVGRDLAAGTAPCGPEIHQDRGLGFQNVVFEGCIGKFSDIGSHWANPPASIIVPESMKAPRGQNFLYQTEWQERVAAAVGPSDALVEIGGGEGGLTERLASRSRQLWVVESDPRLAAQLRERFHGSAAVNVVEADVLTLDLAKLTSLPRVRVAGNLPYYITSPILLHLFRQAGHVQDATLMVQREVGERICAVPGSRSFGLLSATTQFHARPKRLFDLPAGAFRPPPKVISTLLHLSFAVQDAALGVEREAFLRFLRTAFAQKRKQLGKRFGLPLTARAETLSLEQLAELFRQLGAPPSSRSGQHL